ncbi:MAG: aminotransferase class IV [Myxococcales bacterium]|nr:aminotransferase class IV [Myxococcales bacterium]
MSASDLVVAIDGVIVPPERAQVPVTDRGFLLGDSVFETFRTYGGRAHALDRHLARLARSAAALGIDPAITPSALVAEIGAILDVADAAEGRERRVRLVVTRGDAAGLGDDGPARRVIVAAPFAGHPEAYYRDGAPICTVPGGRAFPSAKAGSYLVSVLATREAKARGAHEAIFIDDGQVLEGATSNLFVVVDGALRTAAEGVLPGITRGIVLELAAALGLPHEVGPVPEAALRRASEAFLTSATRGLMPVRAVDDAALPAIRGPFFEALASAYEAGLEGRLTPRGRADV